MTQITVRCDGNHWNPLMDASNWTMWVFHALLDFLCFIPAFCARSGEQIPTLFGGEKGVRDIRH